MVFVFLCLCLITTVTSRSLLDLEIQVNGITAILERGENTTKHLGLEISELKKELDSFNSRSTSSGRLNKLKQKLVVVSSKLDSLKSGQKTAKIERYGIFEDLSQVKLWTKDLIRDTERNWKMLVANFSSGNRDKELDYKEFKKQVLKEWAQWWSQTKETVSRVVAEFEKSKADFQVKQSQKEAEFEKSKADLQAKQNEIEAKLEETKANLQAQQSQIQSRVDSLAKITHSLITCDIGWIKNGSICYWVSEERESFEVASNQCEGFGARLIYLQELKMSLEQMKTNDEYMHVWIGQPLKHINGKKVEVAGFPHSNQFCKYAIYIPYRKAVYGPHAGTDFQQLNFICIKDSFASQG